MTPRRQSFRLTNRDVMTGDARSDADAATIRTLVSEGRYDDSWNLLRPALLAGDTTMAWNVARQLLRAGARAHWAPPTSRQIRLGVLCSYEAAEFSEHLRLACLALGIAAELYLAPYGQLEQELLSDETPLASFAPTHVLIAPTTADLGFPQLGGDPDELLAAAAARWRTLWETVRRDHGARVIQHTFVIPDETPLGHLALRLPASRPSLVRELNRRLAEAAGADVLLVDCERLAARIGKQRWIDPRLWFAARQPYGPEAVPLLARETAAVLAGDVGLAARCLIVDLDNTLWGGVVGEDGVAGIAIGTGPDGEAYAVFQDYLAALAQRGIILAVASKNDLEAAREPFDGNPGMRLKLGDFAAFVADWRRKPEQLAEIAATLGLGLDAVVFADDNLAECAEVSAALPEVSVVPLAVAPSELVRTLASSVRFELSSLSEDDVARQRSYAARAQAAQLRAGASSLPDFWRSLKMRAWVRSLDSTSLARAAQLTQKTNQFNLTLRRHSREEIARLAEDDRAICKTLELTDAFADHGLIGLGFLVASSEDEQTALIDTLLLSCRVIGRTAEIHLLSHLARAARDAGFHRIRGVYEAGPRNALVAELYPKLGFVATGANGNRWEYDMIERGAIDSPYIADEA
jgi:FkbH-like protein